VDEAEGIDVTWMPVGPALLFCPADRPDRFSKAAAVADMVILDLEDGVSAPDRPNAREALMTTLLDPQRTIVRVNPVGTPDFALDVAALAQTPYVTVMLAKTESVNDVNALDDRAVIALCETARGVLEAPNIAAGKATVALMWGAEDLIASLGGRSSRTKSGDYRVVASQARSQVLLAARAHDRAAIDTIHLDIKDVEGLRGEAEDAAASGFCATACIHPTQVAIVRAAFRPTDDEIAWASAVSKAAARERGVFAFEGRMIDAPLLRHAQQILNAVSRQEP
jgi:citrate lyase subunit beta / citryl-CoA lyase